MTPGVLAELRRLRILPLIVMDDPARAGPLGQALLDGGLPCAEVAFRTRAALEALRRMAGEHPDLLVGAGTVISEAQAKDAHAAGARFIVSPGLNERVVGYCRAINLPVFPGVCTPTEVNAALELGLTVLKFFPAEPMGGVAFLQALAAPFAGVEFLPTGGISAANLGSYLALPQVVACGGSWMAPQKLVDAGEFGDIVSEVRRAVQLVQSAAARS